MTDKPNKPFNLNMHTARLLMREPFFAALSRRIDKIASTAIPTAGVRVNPDSAQFEMLYNPEFFDALSDEHKQGILMHEFYHLVFEHVTGRKPAIVLDKQETAQAKYGDIANKRWQFKLHCDGQQGWLDEVRMRIGYKLP